MVGKGPGGRPVSEPTLLRGIDISHWQDADKINWAKLRETHQFVICRAAYGTMRDREVVDHVRHARRQAFNIGLYHFFRACQVPETAQ